MNAKINHAMTPEGAYKPDPQNNPIDCEGMLYILLLRAKAHLSLCMGSIEAEERLADVPVKDISDAISSVVGMLDQAEKTVDYMFNQRHALADNEMLVKLQLSHAGTTEVSGKTLRTAAEKLLHGTSQEIVMDDHGEERIFHINKFSILQGG